MFLNAQVQDESTGQPLAGATVMAQDTNGNPTVLGTTNPLGNAAVNVPETSPNILVVANGYQPKVIDASYVDGGMGVIPMTLAPLGQGQATTAIQNTTSLSIPWWVWAGGAGVLIYAASGSKKKAVGDGGYGWIIPVGIVGGIAYILYQILGKPSATDLNNQMTTTTIAQGTAATLAALAAKGIVPTLTQAQAAAIANGIFQAGIVIQLPSWSSFDQTQNTQGLATIFNLLVPVQNDADIYLIMQNFGTRQIAPGSWSMCAVLQVSCNAVDLDSFITTVLNNADVIGFQLTDLNNQLQYNELGETGVTYNF